MNTPIVSSQWLHKNLTDASIVIIDASQKVNTNNSITNLRQTQIKGARLFDLKNKFSDNSSPFPNTLPSPLQFEEECRNLGINQDSKIIIYDNLGIYFSPRVWWMFKTMGHKNVYVLDGGLPNWLKLGYETVSKKHVEYSLGDFTAQFNPNLVKDYYFIKDNITTQNYLLIDARSTNRFDALEPEPRKGLISGHIPNAINIPFYTVLSNGKFKSQKELVKIFSNKKIQSSPLIFSCGSGVTACIVLLACKLVLNSKMAIYDGSWTEWATLKS